MNSVTRIRAPHKIHVLSWALALERNGTVACHFKDCQFMALSVEEMGNHYPFCACENNKYPFVCETCNRRTDAMEKLLVHKFYSHSYMPTDEESRKINDYLSKPVKKEITSVLRRSWEIFLEKKKYLKCLMRNCLYVTDTIANMEDHYLNSCKESFWAQLKYECEYCHGRLLNDLDLKLHIKQAHGSKTYLIKHSVGPDSNLQRIQIWSEEIMMYKQGKCFNDGCQFVDNYVKILEKHYARCDGTKKNFIICGACGSWLLNELRLNDHKRCFHKDLDEEDFKKLSRQYELESESHSSLLLDDMSPDENGPLSGEVEADSDRRASDLKKYNGVINRASKKSSTLRLSPPVFPAKNTDSIDCTQVSDRSGIQYDSDIIEINEGSLDIIDIDTSVTKKVLNDGMKLNDRKKRRRPNLQYVTEKHCMKDNEKKNFSLFQKKTQENWPTPLQAFANEMMKENKNISTVPVQIKVDNKDWTVNVSTTVVSQSKSSSEFPKNREALFKSLKEESYRLLKMVSKKNSIRNDVRMVFDPNENRITPFHINFRKGDSNDKGPDNLDMTKFLSSDVEDSDDDISNSDISDCDGHDSIGSPVSPPIRECCDTKVPNVADHLINKSNEQDLFRNGNEDNATLKESNFNVEEMRCTNEKPVGCIPDPKSVIDSHKRCNNELNNVFLSEGPLQKVDFYKSHDDQITNDFLEKEANQNDLNEKNDILCLSNINHLGEEVVVKNELDQQVLPKKIIDEETGSNVHIEVFPIKNDQQGLITESNEGAESRNQFESEYIIPEIDFVDNSGFRCSNERINVSDSFQADNSNSSYGFESDTSVNLPEGEVSGMQSNDTSEDVASEECIIKPNEELVLLDNELPSSSLQGTGTGSDVKGEKDPLSMDGFTGGALFYDPETDYDNRDLYSAEKSDSRSCENNIHLSDNNENISDNTQEANEENADDFSLSNKWNWCNLKKYNSKTAQNDLTQINNSCKEHANKQSKEDDNFFGFSDCTDSSSKYSNFVSACNKLGYYDDMVILNQHYEIIPPNKKDKFHLSGPLGHNTSEGSLTATNGDLNSNPILVKKIPDVKTHPTNEVILGKSEIINSHKPGNDSDEFLGFKSNDNYVEFRRKSIEISRRFSEEFPDNKNKIDQNLTCTDEKNTNTDSSIGKDNLARISVSSNALDQSHEQDTSLTLIKNSNSSNPVIDLKKAGSNEKSRRSSIESDTKKRGRPRKNLNQFTVDSVSSTVQRKENTNAASEELNLLENKNKSVVNLLPNQVKEPNQPIPVVDSDDKTENNILVKSSVSSRNDDQNDTYVSCIEVKENNHQSVDGLSLTPNANSLICTSDSSLNDVESRKINSLESASEETSQHKNNSSQLITSSSTDLVNVVSLIKETSDAELKELKPFESEDRSVINDLTKCTGQESTPISETSTDHEIENLRYRDQVTDKSHNSVDHVSIPLENKEKIISTSAESESRIRSRPENNQSESAAHKATIQCNNTLDQKEEYSKNLESNHLECNGESSIHEVHDCTGENQIMPMSTTSNDYISVLSPKSPTSNLTSFSQFINSTQVDNNSLNNETKKLSDNSKQLNSLALDVSSFEIKDHSLVPSNEPILKKGGRPRKNSVHLIASTPTKSNLTICLNGEKTNKDIEESNPFDNEESIINSTADEYNLTASNYICESKIIPIELVNNKETSSSLKPENIEDRPEKKLKLGTPLKRKPGRPPKHLSSCFQVSEQLQRKSSIIQDSQENTLLVEKKDITQTSIKRKPGRPPKRLSLCLQESELLQGRSKIASSLRLSEPGNKNLLNSSINSQEPGTFSFSEQKVADDKEDILKIPLKRKPGRPPKRSLQGSSPLQRKISNILDSSLVISESGNKSFLLNSSASLESEVLSFSKQTSVDDRSRDLLLVEKGGILETPLKRKPGRPPKRLSLDKGNMDQGHKDVHVEKSEIDVNEISESYSKEDSSSVQTQIKIEDLSMDEQLQIGKIESTSISTHGELENVSVGVLEKKIEMEAKTFSNPVLMKRKPGRPPKRLSASVNDQGLKLYQTKNDELYNSPTILESFSRSGHNITLEPPVKRKPGRPPKYSTTCREKMQEYPVENKNENMSTNSIDLDPLSYEVGLSSEDNNQKSQNEEKDSLELMIERKHEEPPNSVSTSRKEIEECQIEDTNVSAKDNECCTKSVLNSLSCEESCSNVTQSKDAKHELETEENSIAQPPFKRKPGRPPKRLSLGEQEIGKSSFESRINSSLLNSSLNMDSLSNINMSPLRGKEKNSIEPPPKRKPGRPPKRLSVGLHGIENKNAEDNSANDSKRFLNSGLLNSCSNKDSLCDVNHFEEEKKVSFEAPLKRKPGRPPKHLSAGQKNITLFQNKNNVLPVNNFLTDFSEPAPKRKPGRPRKANIEIKNNEENSVNNSVDDMDHISVKIEDERLFSTENDSFGVFSLRDTNEASIESSQCLPKRRPGRPKKVSLVLGESPDSPYKLIFDRSDFSIQSSPPSIESSVNSEYTPKRRAGRPKRHTSDVGEGRSGTRASSTPFNNGKTSLSFNSFADLELLDDDNTLGEEVSRKKKGKPKVVKVVRRLPRANMSYSKTYYTTYNDDGSDLETSTIVPMQNRILSADPSLNQTLNSEDGCDNNITETDESQETNCLNDSDLTEKQLARIEKRKLLSGRVDSLTRLKNPNDKVKCALCGELMTVIHYQKEHLLKHNFMSWLEGEEPLPLDDLDKMDTILVRGKRANPKFVFRCEVCRQEKKSARGILSHRQFCGKSDKEREFMMVSCPYCGRLMMPVSLPPHLYQSHRTATDPIASEEESTPGPVRKAAAKCLGKIASLIEENSLAKTGEDFHVDGDEEFDEIEEISLLYIPVQKKKTTKHLMNKWKQLASDNRELHCIVPSCTFKTMQIKQIVKHHRKCTADGPQGFSCIKCNYICKIEDEMREHVKSCNPPIMVSQSDNSEDEEPEKHVIIPYLRAAEQNLTGRYKVQFFKPALTWMNEIYEKYFTQEPLYRDLHLNIDLWEEMDPLTSQFYNPEKSNSMMVSFQNSSWESMHALEGKVIEGNQGIAYTGGPVWGLEWCPGEGPQYLAVSSHLSMEFNFQAGSTFTGPGLVQLWSLEDISNAKSDALSTLQFCYGVCHNERACWNMAWCPSGGRTDTRIGLLALATTSGSIPIYAMPNPECLQYQSTRFYKPEPVLKLELWSNERWQCSAISWSKIKPHNIIAAGFVNGMVAIWNIEAQLKLLRKNIILYPFKVFQAHHSIITGICLSPESGNYLATASYDKSFKYWDLIDTTAPHTVLKRGLFTSVDWLRHWMSAVTTYDNAYTMMQTTVSLSSVRGYVTPTTPIITSINSTAWSVSVNDWLNGAITSYDNGQVVLFLALRQSIYHHLDKRKFSKVILNSALHSIEKKDGPADLITKQKEKEVCHNNMPSNSYEDAVHKYGLSIKTDPDIGRYDKFQEKGSENLNDIYPLSSINRVAWNTNRNSFLYTAMGYQSGFLVVSKLSFNSKESNIIIEASKV